MARTGTASPRTSKPAAASTVQPAAEAPRKPARRTSELAWLRAGDVRLVISHQVAQDRRILAALDSLVKGQPHRAA